MTALKKAYVSVAVMIFLMGAAPAATWSSAQTVAQMGAMQVPFYSIPTRLDFCGEPVPLDMEEVRERFDREFTIVVYSHAQVFLWLKRAQRFFPWIEKQLVHNNLPNDLKYVAVAESDLLVGATSPAKAAGPWQFIPSTGSNYGLSQTGQIDERRDFELASNSAFRYLRDLQAMFQNWTLAVAAYNCGEKRIQEEIRRQKVNSYYLLKLPMETERYIFRILAIKEVLSNPAKYGYMLPKGAGYQPVRTDRVALNLKHTTPLQMIAEAASITYRELKVLNPAFISDTLPKGSHTVKVPEGKGRELPQRLDALLATYQPPFVHHKVARGETLSGIAAKYQVSARSICEWNQLKGNKVLAGQTLKIAR
ncbi:MAG TPA: transglycosylase SLT domain-containing protein [Syntrophobacteraceae bacterium]|nr:transglycosylase SLT domain-containing protein [Syntrophobacteraceae bacterium]